VHVYTQTIHRTKQSTRTIHRTTQLTTKWEECGPCPVFASYTLAFALQLRKKGGETSVRNRENPQSGTGKNFSEEQGQTSFRSREKRQSGAGKNLSQEQGKT